jgi:hypothetical protein
MRRAFLDHLQDSVEHTHDGAKRPILALGEATQPIEVAKKLVRTVDEMNHHEALSPDILGRSYVIARAKPEIQSSGLHRVYTC